MSRGFFATAKLRVTQRQRIIRQNMHSFFTVMWRNITLSSGIMLAKQWTRRNSSAKMFIISYANAINHSNLCRSVSAVVKNTVTSSQ